jgi:hypothetical protein
VTFARTTGAVALTSVAIMVAAMSVRGGAHPTGAVTWSTVSRVLAARCLSCHGPGGGAAPRLDGYEHARLAAGDMKRAVLERRMPPWYAVEGFGDFADNPTLTPIEAAWVADWADAGAPDDPAGAEALDLPPEAGSHSTAAVGSHGTGGAAAHAHHAHGEELVLRTPAYQVEQPSHTFALPTGLTRDRWVRGWEVRPGNRAFVLGAVFALAPGTTLGTWTAGDGMTMLPDGVAARIPRGSTIHLTLKYRRASMTTAGDSSVRFLLADSPGRQIRTLSLPCGSSKVPRDIDALSIRPARDLPGEALTVEARRPDRSVEPIAWFQNFPRAHDRTYWFRRPVALPAGTSISVAAADAHCGADLEYVER